jgi:drug/metabolite transporter (DMT)-like permease
MPFLYLCLGLLSSLSIALALRMFEHKGRDRTVVIASNYIVAGILAYLLLEKAKLTTPVFFFGAVLGLFFFVGFMAFSRAIKSKGVAASVTIGRLSLALPVAFSIFLWGEKPLPADIAGLLLIFVIILTWEGKLGKVSPILLFLFLLFGLLDSAMKYFKLQFPATDDSFFLVIVFFSSMVWSWGYILFKRKKVKAGDMAAGLLMGVPNFFSSYFLLKALGHIPAYVVFPFLNVGMIILSALAGWLLFKEKLNRKKMILLLMGIAAVLVLTT